MSLDLFSGRRMDTRVPRRVLAALDAAADIAKIFGSGGVVANGADEFDGPIRPPFMRVIPRETGDARLPSYQLSVEYAVELAFYLPRATPARDSVTPPPVPTLSARAAGTLSGSFLYAATAFDSTGESYVAESVGVMPVPQLLAVNYANEKGTIAVAAHNGLRLWRTPAGQLLPRPLAVLPAGVTSFVDEVADADLGHEVAPIRFLVETIKGYILAACANAEPLFDGDQVTDPCTRFSQTSQGVVANRNLLLTRLATTWPLIADVRTREPLVAVVP